MESPKSEKEKIQRIKNILEREIEKELTNKQNEVTDISEKIKNVLRNLDLLKYIVAVNYYDQNTSLTQKKGQEDENEEEKTQHQIHPCVKKLFPFKSNYNNSFGDAYLSHSYETRKSKKSGLSDFAGEVKKEANTNLNQNNCDKSSGSLKLPQYVPPLPSAEEVETDISVRGGLSKERYRIIVGNISKWIAPDTREDNSTHKWMVYVRSKDTSKDVMKLLKKVRYFLHESYKPHDIIDVTSPPFRLTRRGWGEFPIRVQLHFTHPLNKPVDIIHNLKLDMTCSGIQMLGGETIVDLWLHQDNSVSSEKSESKPELSNKINLVNEVRVREKQDVFDGSLLTSINGIKPSNCVVSIKEETTTDEVLIKQEPEDYFEYGKPINSKMEEVNLAINNSRMYLLDRRKIMKIIEIEHNYLKTDESDSNKSFNNFTNSVLKFDTIKTSEKTLKNGALLDLVQVNQIINKKNQGQLNKIGVTLNKSEEEIFKSLKAVANKIETETQSKYSMKVFKQMYLANIIQRVKATKLRSVEALIKWFVQRWPIITNLSLDQTYKFVHPYSSPNEEEFSKYNIGKQRSAEWFRAKAIQKVLFTLKTIVPIEEEIWSTKQILLWSRFHGYSPSSFQMVKNETTEANDLGNKRLKSNDSSSDSDEGTADNPVKKLKRNDDRFLNGLNATERKNYKKSRRKESPEISDRDKNYKELNPCSEASDSQRFGANEFRVLQPSDSDCDIEVVKVVPDTVKESPSKKKEVKLSVATTPSSEKPFNSFVCDTVREIGIKVVEEEVIPGVQTDSVSRVLSQCASNFLDELLRRSFAQAWSRNGDRCPDSLEVKDILATLIEYHRFDIFTNRGLGIPGPEKS